MEHPYRKGSLLALAVLGVWTHDVLGGDAPADGLTFEKDAVPLLERYCTRCHGSERPKAKLDLSRTREGDALLRDRKDWERVTRALRERQMPPRRAEQPSESERALLVEVIEAELSRIDCSDGIDPGRPALRRLNRVEYRNTVRDLTGVDYEPAMEFPGDEIGYGFDTIGDVLSMPPLLLEKYLDAAEEITGRIFASGEGRMFRPVRFQAEDVERLRLEATPDTAVVSAALAFFKEREVALTHEFPAGGEYLLKALAWGDQAGPEPARMAFRIDGKDAAVVDVPAEGDAPEVYSARVRVEAGEHEVGVAYVNNYNVEDAADPSLRGDRNLYVDWFELQLVRSDERDRGRRRIFTADPVGEHGRPEPARLREVLSRFVSRAYRRPAKPEELKRLLALVDAAREAGDSLEDALGVAFQAVLVSPHFLYRIEIDPEPGNPAAAYPLGQYEMASRLSYFLWSTMPDAELLWLAEIRKLQDDGVLEAQVRRMLRDPRARALVENFAGQWLQTRFLSGATPDPEHFPQFDEDLRRAFQEETYLFFETLLREDRSVLELIDSDFTFVNERLARHYGIEGIEGEAFRRVAVGGTPRGGVLTQGSVLTITSYPTRTSPVLRGKWILERILGAPPPPPPPDVPELEEEADAILSGTLRQRLEKHRENPNCAVCHDKLDPLGFAFENFDAIGAWREFDGRFLIDASAALPGGERFDGPAALKEILKSRGKAFARTLTEEMLTYALGRGLEYYDQCAVDQIVGALAEGEYRFSRLVAGIVKSEPFRRKRGGETR